MTTPVPVPAAAPAVSVVMSVYNAGRFVAAAVDSILAQTLGDFEFIIVDDGSTDRSRRILQGYAAADARVRLVSRPNTGLTRALNEGLALARGTYVARMDADDVAVPHRFARQVEYLGANPACVCVGSRVMLTDPYGSPVAESGHKLTHAEIDQELLTGSGWAMVHPAVMMRRSAVLAVGGYHEQWKHCEDHDLFLRLAEIGRVANLPEVLLWYRRHPASINATRSTEQAAQKESLLREAHARRGQAFPAGWSCRPWAPLPEPRQRRLWGWAALKAGNAPVARRHAVRAVRGAPLSPEAWRLMYCALRGR